MKKLSLYIATLLALIIMAGGIYFLFIKASDETEIIDFIKIFDSAKKNGFNEDIEINSFLSPRTYSVQNVVWDKLITLFSSRGKIISRNSNSVVTSVTKTGDKGFYLNFYNDTSTIHTYSFESAKYGDDSNIKVQLISGTDSLINITRVQHSNEEIIDSFKVPCESNKYNVLQVVKFADFLLISLNRKQVFQMKAAELYDVKLRDFTPPSPNQAKFILKVLEIEKTELDDFLASIKKMFPVMPDHKFNLDAQSWNSLYPEYKIVNTPSVSQYLRRLNLNGMTMPSIYFPADSSLKYEVTLPDNPVLDFALAAIPDYFGEGTELSFKVNICKSGDSESAIEHEFIFDKNNAALRTFEDASITLDKFSGEEVLITFSVPLIDNNPQPDEKKILTALGSPAIYSRKEKPEKPNVILVVLDTLRADHLGCYGCKVKDISPNIDSFASESALMENTMSNSSWTLPSHMSLFTSLFPGETGYRKSAKGYNNSRFAENVKLFSEYLKEAGYKTAAITGGSYVSSSFGFDRGFSSYYENYEDMSISMDKALAWLQNNRDKEFFLFFHTYETHEPYRHTYYLDQAAGSNLTENERTELKYDSGIRYADTQFGRFIDWLKKNDLFDNTIILLTSDHGEKFDKLKLDSLGNYAGTHGFTLYDRVTHVPLIIRGPAPFDKPLKIKDQTSLVDIMPTILTAVGIEVNQPCRGTDLTELMKSKDKKAERIAFAEATRGRWDRKSLRTNNYKFIASINTEGQREKPTKELYDLKQDPNEIKNIQDSQKKTVIAFAKKLEILLNSILETQRRLKIRVAGELSGSSDLMKTLEGLGYIHEM